VTVVVVSPDLGVVVTEPRLDPAVALLTLTVALVVGVVVVAAVVVVVVTPPTPPLVICVAVVFASDPPTDPTEVEPRLARTWLNPATPAMPIVTPKRNEILR
jgi:hypothetical protein